MKNDLSSYKSLYIKTAQDYLETMQENIKKMNNDKSNKDAREVLYRCAHSLKSQSSVMGYTEIVSLSEFIEDTFRDIQDTDTMLEASIFAEIETTLAKIEKSLEQLLNAGATL